MDKKTLYYINAVLSNDENSSNKEIKKIFTSQGISESIADKAILYRSKFFIDRHFELNEKDLSYPT